MKILRNTLLVGIAGSIMLSPVLASAQAFVPRLTTSTEIILAQSEEELLKQQRRQERIEQRKQERIEQRKEERVEKRREERSEQRQERAAEPEAAPRRQERAAEPDRSEAEAAERQRDSQQAEQAREEQREQRRQQQAEERAAERQRQREQAQEQEAAPEPRQREEAREPAPQPDGGETTAQQRREQRILERQQAREAERRAREQDGAVEPERQPDGATTAQERREQRVRERQQAREEERRAREQAGEQDGIGGPLVRPGVPDPASGDQAAEQRRQQRIEERREQRVEERRRQAEQRREQAEERREQRIEQRGDDRRQARETAEMRERRIAAERDARRDAEERLRDRRVVERGDGRLVVRDGQREIVYSDDIERMGRNARDVRIERLDDGRRRVVVVKPNGDRIVTVYDRYDQIVTRTRIDAREREQYIIDNRRDGRYEPGLVMDFGRVLPPLVLSIPQEQYVVESAYATPIEIEDALLAPPVETVERPYTLSEVRYSERLRDKVRRVDLDTITFDTGSADITSDQIDSLEFIGTAIGDIVDRDPNEVFLIEGHTDAVGSDLSNLTLSDRRAESVALALTEDFGIPPENIVTQGYGEQDLKVETDGPARENRRVTMRRITPLLAQAAEGQDGGIDTGTAQ